MKLRDFLGMFDSDCCVTYDAFYNGKLDSLYCFKGTVKEFLKAFEGSVFNCIGGFNVDGAFPMKITFSPSGIYIARYEEGFDYEM